MRESAEDDPGRCDAEFSEQGYLSRYPDVVEAIGAGRWSSGWEHFQAHGKAEGRKPGPSGSPLGADLAPRARSGEALFRQHNGAGYLAPDDLTVTDVRPKRIAMIGSCFLEQWGLHRSNPSGCAVDLIVNNHMAELPALDPDQIRAYDFQLLQLPLRAILRDHPFWRLAYNDLEGHERILDAAKQTLDAMLQAQMAWNREHGLLTFVCNFPLPQKNPNGALFPRFDPRNPQYVVEQLNAHLERTVRASPNAYVLDIDQIAASLGRARLQDDTILLMGHGALLDRWEGNHGRIESLYPLTDYYDLSARALFGEAVWAELVSMYRAVRQADPVKLVVVDLDDTLWHGVSGETADVGPHMFANWPLGLIEALMFLKKRGVLLAICSQNEERRIREIWPRIFGPRITLDDFAALAINWRPKAENMAEVLAGLNLLPRNVVFIDDNPVERAAMQQAFPDMRILGRHPYYLRRILLWSSETQVAAVTEESGRRTEMVQAQLERESQRKAMTREEFLARAAPRAALVEVAAVEGPRFQRCLELINKTNQFNTTGERRTREGLEAFLREGGRLWSFEAADAFTTYGLVGVVLARGTAIEQWVMSCRVLGYDLEKAVMARLVEHLRLTGPAEITGRLVETEVNFPCRDFFAKTGFVASGGGAWRLPADVGVEAPPHVDLGPAIAP
jgi:FkbH-like protein